MKTRLTRSELSHGIAHVQDRARNDLDFVISSLAAGAVAALGFALDNVLLIAASIFLSPLMYPTVLLALSISVGDAKGALRSFLTLITAMLATVLLAGLTYLFVGAGSGVLFFSQFFIPPVLHFFLAVLAGLIVTFTILWPTAQDAVWGGALMVLFVPALAALGVGIVLGAEAIMITSLILFTLTFIGFLLGSIVAYALLRLVSNID